MSKKVSLTSEELKTAVNAMQTCNALLENTVRAQSQLVGVDRKTYEDNSKLLQRLDKDKGK